MLSPEVWNIKPPSSNLSFTEGYFKNSESLCILKKHYFNHSVSVVLPDTLLIPEALNNALSENCDYYKLSNFPVSQFIDKEFISAFIKSGEMTALSVGTNIDTDNCVAITPCGYLVMSLLRETYQELGLEGKQSASSRKSPSRYVVHVNLKEANFLPGKKKYERVLKCLSEHVSLNMNFLIAWEPKDDTVCPSSVAAYFFKKGYKVSLCSPKYISRKEYDVKVPNLTAEPRELLEWVGAFSLRIKLQKENAVDEYLSSYIVPHESESVSQVTMLHWLGFFTTAQLQRCLKLLQTYVESRSDIGWGSFHVEGFTDTPVSWGLEEHSNGDNHYTLFLRPDKHYLACKLSKPCKLMK